MINHLYRTGMSVMPVGMSKMVTFAIQSVHHGNTGTTTVFARTVTIHAKLEENAQDLVPTKDLEVVMIVTCSLWIQLKLKL